jgi:hypothetical protein
MYNDCRQGFHADCVYIKGCGCFCHDKEMLMKTEVTIDNVKLTADQVKRAWEELNKPEPEYFPVPGDVFLVYMKNGGTLYAGNRFLALSWDQWRYAFDPRIKPNGVMAAMIGATLGVYDFVPSTWKFEKVNL